MKRLLTIQEVALLRRMTLERSGQRVMCEVLGFKRWALLALAVRRTLGHSWSEFLLSARMTRAAELLQTMNGRQVARALGYTHYTSFTRAFEKFHGKPLGAFRPARLGYSKPLRKRLPAEQLPTAEDVSDLKGLW